MADGDSELAAFNKFGSMTVARHNELLNQTKQFVTFFELRETGQMEADEFEEYLKKLYHDSKEKLEQFKVQSEEYRKWKKEVQEPQQQAQQEAEEARERAWNAEREAFNAEQEKRNAEMKFSMSNLEAMVEQQGEERGHELTTEVKENFVRMLYKNNQNTLMLEDVQLEENLQHTVARLKRRAELRALKAALKEEEGEEDGDVEMA